MEKITIKTEYIKLDQFLKYTGICNMGSEAKLLIANGEVNVNGSEEKKRGKKLRKGDIVEVHGREFLIDIVQ
ncbi:MAG: S4 domain-containing protein YaaA [Acetivibrionales bacterium]|jgi:ribosome-associated protein